MSSSKIVQSDRIHRFYNSEISTDVRIVKVKMFEMRCSIFGMQKSGQAY